MFVYLQGREPLEITLKPSGQNLVAPQPGTGRKAHFWWTLDELEATQGEVLRMLAPNLDRVWVGRDGGLGQQLQTVFDGTVVECGHDPSMVSVTAMEPQRQAAAPPPAAPPGGVREPLRPVPAGPGPEGVAPPGPQPQPQPVPLGSPHEATVTGGGQGGQVLSSALFVRGRDAVAAT